MMKVLLGLAVLAVMGALFGLLLAAAAKAFAVDRDPREEAVLACLPGVNCGGCGYPGCAGFAAAVAAGRAEVNGCPVGGGPTAQQLAAIMGVTAGETVRRRAVVHSADSPQTKYEYVGLRDCLAASLMAGGGPMSDPHSCLGMGTCVKACPFDALRVREGTAVVDGARCRACGRCVEACPLGLITMEVVEEPPKPTSEDGPAPEAERPPAESVKSSAEAFQALEEAVAAAGQVLGEAPETGEAAPGTGEQPEPEAPREPTPPEEMEKREE